MEFYYKYTTRKTFPRQMDPFSVQPSLNWCLSAIVWTFLEATLWRECSGSNFWDELDACLWQLCVDVYCIVYVKEAKFRNTQWGSIAHVASRCEGQMTHWRYMCVHVCQCEREPIFWSIQITNKVTVEHHSIFYRKSHKLLYILILTFSGRC